MTPEQAAIASGALTEAPDKPELVEFFKKASARDIQDFIHRIQIVDRHRAFSLARVALDIRLSEDADISTRRIVKLTRWLVVLTMVLVVFTVVLVVFTAAFYKDAHAQVQHDKAANHATQN